MAIFVDLGCLWKTKKTFSHLTRKLLNHSLESKIRGEGSGGRGGTPRLPLLRTKTHVNDFPHPSKIQAIRMASLIKATIIVYEKTTI